MHQSVSFTRAGIKGAATTPGQDTYADARGVSCMQDSSFITTSRRFNWLKLIFAVEHTQRNLKVDTVDLRINRLVK